MSGSLILAGITNFGLNYSLVSRDVTQIPKKANLFLHKIGHLGYTSFQKRKVSRRSPNPLESTLTVEPKFGSGTDSESLHLELFPSLVGMGLR